MYRVFLSHASPDKPRLKPIAQALVKAGFRLWVDHPDQLGLEDHHGPDVEARQRGLVSGSQYREQIDQALREVDAVLVCWSQAAKDDRKVWHSEATAARTLEKLVACRIDTVDPRDLPDQHGEQVIIEAQDAACVGLDRFLGPTEPGKAQLERLIAGLKRKCPQTRQQQGGKPLLSNPLLLYMVDRREQWSALKQQLATIPNAGGVPQPFLAIGPENEQLLEFIEQFRQVMLPKWRGDVVGDIIYPEWPAQVPASNFTRVYSDTICEKIADQDLPTALRSSGRPVIVASFLRAGEWQPGEEQRIRAWLKFWQDFPAGAPEVPVLPFLLINLGSAEAGWTVCPPGPKGAVMSNASIVATACRLAPRCHWPATACRARSYTPWPCRKTDDSAGTPAAAPVSVCRLPLLKPILKSHAESWAHSLKLPAESETTRKDVLDRIKELYTSDLAAGVPMADFAKAMLAGC